MMGAESLCRVNEGTCKDLNPVEPTGKCSGKDSHDRVVTHGIYAREPRKGPTCPHSTL